MCGRWNDSNSLTKAGFHLHIRNPTVSVNPKTILSSTAYGPPNLFLMLSSLLLAEKKSGIGLGMVHYLNN